MQGGEKNNMIKHVIASRIVFQALTVHVFGILGARRDVLALGAFLVFVSRVNFQHLWYCPLVLKKP